MQSENLICQECGTGLETENHYIFLEKCSKCGKILCFNCLSINSALQYSCKECLVNSRQGNLLQKA